MPDAKPAITLTPQQYAVYQKKSLAIKAPDGTLLEHIGTTETNDTAEICFARTQEQLALINCILDGVTQPAILSTRAFMGLSQLLYRLQDHIVTLDKQHHPENTYDNLDDQD